MLVTTFIIIGVSATFGLGYYIGNQLGKTEHIRQRLAKYRDQNSHSNA